MTEKALSHVCSGNATFSNKLYEILSTNEGNVLYSPLSAHAVLSLVYQGAAGKTAKIIGKSLDLSDTKSTAAGYQSLMETLNSVDNVILHIANKVFVHHERKLKDEFDAIAKKHYLAETENIAFFPDNAAAAKKINAWVENKTNNKITDLIQPGDLHSDTHLVLVNAIYFKGNWLHEFDPESTKKEKFYLNKRDTVECDMMHITKDFLYAEYRKLDAQIVSLPYKNKDFSLMIILPRSKAGIEALEKKLVTKNLSAISRKLSSVEVILSLPKFKIETTMDLNSPLRKLGMDIIFSTEADFGNMLENCESLHVSKVIQKAFIEVNELGAEAAASMWMEQISGYMKGSRRKCYIFQADHPFAFYLCYHLGKNTLPLFSGTLKTLS